MMNLPQKRIRFLLLLLFCGFAVVAQKSKADSLVKLLATTKPDTNRVRLMWQLAGALNMYKPDSAVRLSQQAVYLSKELNYPGGESKSLGAMANAVISMGNYPRALDLYFQKLQLDEKQNIPRDLASVLMNIGIVYVRQEEFDKALDYYYKADTVIRRHQVEEMKYYVLLNLGDVYNRLNNSDSAYRYFNQSLELAKGLNDTDLIAASMTGLGHSYLKMQNYQESLVHYKAAIAGLRAVNDDELLCEATLGLAGLYQQLNKNDSAVWWAQLSKDIAKKDGFISLQLEAVAFLTQHYQSAKNIDSAFSYVRVEQELNDSINSKTRIRESQILSTNEKLRQLEIEENKRLALRERNQQLQLLFIGIFIPGFFLFTLLLSRIKIHTRIIKVLGILSLLILFEYLTLLLHPYVLELTHHTPVYEILIFVAIAALLIPAHHRLEHWLIKKLTTNKVQETNGGIRLITKRIKIKRPSA
ncbi:MAG: tetratricopeptide repeat protein [Chitinophagaceae bacterium]